MENLSIWEQNYQKANKQNIEQLTEVINMQKAKITHLEIQLKSLERKIRKSY
jgi:hypothetical protein